MENNLPYIANFQKYQWINFKKIIGINNTK